MSKKTEKIEFQARQGDVFVENAEVPIDASPVAADGKRIILAAGEVTGHHHVVPFADAAIVARGAERFLRVKRPTMQRHEEHGPIVLPGVGAEVTIQREYTPEAIRNVVD